MCQSCFIQKKYYTCLYSLEYNQIRKQSWQKTMIKRCAGGKYCGFSQYTLPPHMVCSWKWIMTTAKVALALVAAEKSTWGTPRLMKK